MSAPVYVCRALIVSPDLPMTRPTMLFGQSTVAVARFKPPCPVPAGVCSMLDSAKQVLRRTNATASNVHGKRTETHVRAA